MKLLTKTLKQATFIILSIILLAISNSALASERTGYASWYGPGFHGRLAADGSRFNQNQLTAAHRTLPFGSKVRVTCTSTGKSTVVKITDRGPFHGNRVMDLSKAAAKEIGMLDKGVSKIKYEILKD